MNHEVSLNRSIAGNTRIRLTVEPSTAGLWQPVQDHPRVSAGLRCCGSCTEATKPLRAAPFQLVNQRSPEVHPMRVVSTMRRLRRKVRRTTTTAGSWTIRPAKDLAEDPALRDT